MASMMVLSSSVSAPSISTAICLRRRCQIANDAGQLVPDHADGLHPRLHDAFLQFTGDQIQALRRGIEYLTLLARIELENLVTG